ncbi:MAG: hypothetical protein B9S27_03370 [Opitutia bacterium Tous-C8FEB]|nr:MAG: hypothetical protein B9S27_03370 [Opitutae bacterium Tous-C8FEB]
MKILTLQFVLALAVLFFPRNALRAGNNLVRRKRRRSSGSERILEPWKDREPGDPRIAPAVEFLKPRNYLDLVRAAAGGVALWGGFYVPPALAADPAAGGRMPLLVLGLKCLITLLAVVVQSIRYEKVKVSFFPPIFFLGGLAVGALGYQAAAFAFIGIWVVNAGISNAQGFLSVYALLLLVFGLLFNGWRSIPAAAMAFTAFFPVLLSLMVRRPLMIFTRKGSRD